ncbi:MAG: PrsW family intramembrane metalloprotease [Dehalococcoidia bacterium]|nr:PrsW family intramembrane metalloprotease [Dehalococcoidia bacterium]
MAIAPRWPKFADAAFARQEPRWPARRRARRSTSRRAATWAGAVVGTTVLLACLIAAAASVVALTQSDRSAPAALGVMAGAVAFGVFAMGLLSVSARAYARILCSLLAVVLITTGWLMLTLAPALRQMNTVGLAEYRAFDELLGFGVLSLLAGIVLAVACVRWALQRAARRALARWSRLLGSAYGVALGISGLLVVFTLLFAGASSGPDTSVVEATIYLSATAMWAFVPGLILTYQGISASMGEGSSPFHLAPAAWLVAAWAAVLALGWWMMTRDVPVAAPMPLLHVLAAALPGLALVAIAAHASPLAGHPVRGLTWRQVTLAAAISMTVGVSLSLYVESLGSFSGVVLLLVHNGAFAGVQDSDGFFRAIRDSSDLLSRNEQFAANLIAASIFAPIVEEFGKGIAVRFLLRRDTTRAQAFVLGAAAGAAFAFLETMLYAVPTSAAGGAGSWGPTMLIRAGGLHVIGTAVVGLAWWYAVNGGRPRLAWLLFALVVLNHAAWNAFATVLDARIFGLDTLSSRMVDIIAYAVIAVVSAGYIVAIPTIARRLRRADAAPVSRELGALAPWLGDGGLPAAG